MGKSFERKPPPYPWGSPERTVSEIWEPPAPLGWTERHPHLVTLIAIAVLIGAYFIFV